jgi:hypothetical protein
VAQSHSFASCRGDPVSFQNPTEVTTRVRLSRSSSAATRCNHARFDYHRSPGSRHEIRRSVFGTRMSR